MGRSPDDFTRTPSSQTDRRSRGGIAHPATQMQPLPIDSVLEELCRTLSESDALVLEAPPGAGKTTRVPSALLESGVLGQGEVIVTEPRRLAARLAAHRVASERGERLGDRVGYNVRFEQVGGARTRLRYVTEGILLRRLMADPELSGVSLVILDEFHERHLETDLLLSLLAAPAPAGRRKPKLLVMSATLDAEPVARFLRDCPRLRSEGRVFPVSIDHLSEPDDRPLQKQVVSAVRRLFKEGPAGDILVFLPGAAEIRSAGAELSSLSSELGFLVTPLHGDLPIAEQARAIEPASRPKVVLSTNVAESSITIEGVVAVIDSGLARRAGHSPWTGLPTLSTAKISRASAAQRAGRAGRTREGRVLRLYTRGDLLGRPEFDVPEIARADLTEALLTLYGLGDASRRPERLEWLTPPPEAALTAGRELLSALGALDTDTNLTPIGRRLLELPLHPRLGRLVIEGELRGVPGKAVLAASLLGERDIRLSRRQPMGGRRDPGDIPAADSDLLELVDAFELARELDFNPHRLRAHDLDARAIDRVARAERQLAKLVRRADDWSDEDAEQAMLIATLTGFVDRLARRKKPGSSELIFANGTSARLSPSSAVRHGELLVAVDVEEQNYGKTMGQATVRIASSVRAEWLLDLFSEKLLMKDELFWNDSSERVERVSRLSFGAVVLDESRSAAESGPDTARALLRAAETRGAAEFIKSDSLTLLLERVTLLRTHYPNAGFPSVEPTATLERAAQHLTSFAELRAVDLTALLLSELTTEQQRMLEREAPREIRLPSGRNARIHYDSGRPPWLESRLQDFFGLSEGPRLCGGRVPVTLHLLSPNGRAVQVTTDLLGFWQRHYATVRRELMRRYPRHAWPEDGRTATPVAAKR